MAIDRGGVGVQAEPSVTPPHPDHPPSSRGEQSTGKQGRGSGNLPGVFSRGKSTQTSRAGARAGRDRERESGHSALAVCCSAGLQHPGPPRATCTAGEDQGIVWFDLLVHVINSVIYMFE